MTAFKIIFGVLGGVLPLLHGAVSKRTGGRSFGVAMADQVFKLLNLKDYSGLCCRAGGGRGSIGGDTLGDLDLFGGQERFENGWGERHQEAPLAPVNVEGVQLEDGGLGVEGKFFFRPEGGGAPHDIAAVILCHGGFAGLNRFDSKVAGEGFGGDLPVPVHQDDERGLGVGFHDEGFDDAVFVCSELPGGGSGAAALFVAVGVDLKGHLGSSQGSQRAGAR